MEKREAPPQCRSIPPPCRSKPHAVHGPEPRRIVFPKCRASPYQARRATPATLAASSAAPGSHDPRGLAAARMLTFFAAEK